jgi:uncharacterized protein with PQ loop repeat
MTLADILGFAASMFAIGYSVPQTFRMLRHRHDCKALQGISITAPIMAMTSGALVFVYGLSLGAMPIWIPPLVTVPFHALNAMFIATRRFRKLTLDAEPDPPLNPAHPELLI